MSLLWNVKGTGSLTQYAARVFITCVKQINILAGGRATCLLSGEKIDYRNAAKREARISCKPLYLPQNHPNSGFTATTTTLRRGSITCRADITIR